MPFGSRLPIEFDHDSGGLVPIAVTRERRRAYMRECYPERVLPMPLDGMPAPLVSTKS
jgi:hypothetical protein